jgi:hypothetical protein
MEGRAPSHLKVALLQMASQVAGDLVDKEEEIGDIRIAQFRSRAFENAVGVASSIRPGLGSD